MHPENDTKINANVGSKSIFPIANDITTKATRNTCHNKSRRCFSAIINIELSGLVMNCKKAIGARIFAYSPAALQGSPKIKENNSGARKKKIANGNIEIDNKRLNVFIYISVFIYVFCQNFY